MLPNNSCSNPSPATPSRPSSSLHLKQAPGGTQAVSWNAATVSVDPHSNLIYAMDALPGEIAAVRLSSSGLHTAWKVTQTTTEFIAIIGPPDPHHRTRLALPNPFSAPHPVVVRWNPDIASVRGSEARYEGIILVLSSTKAKTHRLYSARGLEALLFDREIASIEE